MYKKCYNDYDCMSDGYYEDFQQSNTCDCCCDVGCKPYPTCGITGPMGPRGANAHPRKGNNLKKENYLI